jgi:hypothetical protein
MTTWSVRCSSHCKIDQYLSMILLEVFRFHLVDYVEIVSASLASACT